MRHIRTTKRVSTRFGRQTRFELEPKFERQPPEEAQRVFEQLKARVLHPVLHQVPDSELRRQLRLAANEAAAVAWTTPFPLLILPALLEEKAAEVHQYAVRQEQVQTASPMLVETAE